MARKFRINREFVAIAPRCTLLLTLFNEHFVPLKAAVKGELNSTLVHSYLNAPDNDDVFI